MPNWNLLFFSSLCRFVFRVKEKFFSWVLSTLPNCCSSKKEKNGLPQLFFLFSPMDEGSRWYFYLKLIKERIQNKKTSKQLTLILIGNLWICNNIAKIFVNSESPRDCSISNFVHSIFSLRPTWNQLQNTKLNPNAFESIRDCGVKTATEQSEA